MELHVKNFFYRSQEHVIFIHIEKVKYETEEMG